MNDEVSQIKERLDIVDIISGYLTLKRAGAYMKAPCPFHNEKTPSFMVSPERQTFKCFGCFPAGQLIETAEGFKQIQKIKKGDLVYSSEGRLRKVNLVFRRDYSGDLYTIITRMISSPVKITGDHKVYVIKTKNCKQEGRKSRICQKNCKQNCPTKYFKNYKLEKIEARYLCKNDYLLYPIKEIQKYDHIIDLISYTNSEHKRGLKPRNFHSRIKIDECFARLSGLYIAEGSNHRAYIRFSLSGKEEKLGREIMSLIHNIFGLNSSIHYRKHPKTGIEVTCCNSLLARVFKELFGKGAINKKIPSFFFSQKQEVIDSLIKGIVDGDGTVSKTSKKARSGRIAIKVISHHLVHQLKDILLRMGIRPSINFSKGYVSQSGTKHKETWNINWYEQVYANYSDFFETKEGKEYWLLPIREIIKNDFKGVVYNLNIQEDHSYLTQSFAVGNCGEGGDIFTFIEKMEGIDFYNALKLLADRAGVKLQSKSIKFGSKEFKPDKKTKVYEINDWAKKLYHKILLDHPKAKLARDYLLKRGLDEETIKDFEIGYAPDSWDLLIKFLEKKGYKADEAVQAGVAIRNEKGSIYDRFRGRIMFPINNTMGGTVAFTSRVLQDHTNAAKYINSSESPIYVKGKTIYGLDKAKIAIREADLAIMVEGNMDVIACHQAGFKNVVATSGTAITPDQLKILNRYGTEIAFCFDSDTAGETAMKRAITLALQNDISAKIISLPPPFKDPDEAIKKDPKHWERSVKNAAPALEHWIDLLIRKNPELDVSTKKAIAKEILPVIKTIYSDIEKEYYIKYLSSKLSVSEKALIATLSKTKGEAKERKEEIDQIKINLLDKIEGFLWHDQSLLELADKELENFSDERLPQFSKMIQAKKINKKEITEEEKNLLNQNEILALADLEKEDVAILSEEFKFLLKRFRLEKKDAIKSEYAKKIQQAEAKGDREQLKALLIEFSSLIK